MKAIVLLSGGLDSTVVLAMALAEGLECITVSFDYQQRHRIELQSAVAVANHYKVQHHLIQIDPTCFNGKAISSSLISSLDVPTDRTLKEMSEAPVPSTYVPARNTLFLAYALGLAEVNGAQEIHFGPNALDYNSYPDCRSEYISAYQNLINLATKQSIEDAAPKLVTPLIHLNKAEIVKKGVELAAPFKLTWSCYSPKNEQPCGHCDACTLRSMAFEEAKNKT